MGQSIDTREKKEEKDGEEFLSSIDKLQNNLVKIKSDFEKSFLKKEQEYQDTSLKAKKVIDKLTADYNKIIFSKDSEINDIKSSIKEVVTGYETLILKKDDYIKNLKKQVRYDDKIYKVLKGNESLEKDFFNLKNENSVLHKEILKQKEAYNRKLMELENSSRKTISSEVSSKTKEIIDDIALAYKKKLNENNEKNKKAQIYVKKLISKYENLILEKDKKIQFLQSQINDENKNIENLKKTGLPSELIRLSREEILKKLQSVLKENLVLEKKLKALNEKILLKQEDYYVSKKTYEKTLESLSGKLSKLQSSNNFMESGLSDLKDKFLRLASQKTKEKEMYENRIVQLISHYESKINEIIEKNTREQLNSEISINMFQKQIDEYKNKISDKKAEKDEFLKEVEEKIRSVISPKASEFLNKYESDETSNKTFKAHKSEELDNLIKSALSKGDTKEKIIQKMISKNYDKTEILNAYKNIKK